jgi:hypothetical protein
MVSCLNTTETFFFQYASSENAPTWPFWLRCPEISLGCSAPSDGDAAGDGVPLPNATVHKNCHIAADRYAKVQNLKQQSWWHVVRPLVIQ